MASGQGMGGPGIMVRGVRPKLEGQAISVYGNYEVYRNWGPDAMPIREDD